MPDTGIVQVFVPIGIIFISALGVVVAASGLVYWAIHNLGKDLREEMRLHREEARQENQLLREEMQRQNDLLREEMRQGFARLETVIMRHQHDDDGFPIVRFRPGDGD